jgi:hypothetical protein
MKFSRSDFEMQRFESSRPSHAVGLRAGKNTLTRTRRPSGLRAKSPKSSPRDKAADRCQQRNQCQGAARRVVQGRCSNDFRDQGRASGRWFRGCRRVARRAAGPALPTRRTKPRRITEQGGRDLNRALQLGFLFLGGAALLVASPLGLAMVQVNCETFPTGPGRNLGYPNFTRCPFSIGVGCFHHRPIITRMQAARG